MPRGEVPYTRMDCTVPLDRVLSKLADDEFRVWFDLHCLAVHDRHYLLKQSEYTDNYLASWCRVRADKFRRIKQSLLKRGLLAISNNDTLLIVGARDKNPGLAWKDSPNGDKKSPSCPHDIISDSGSDSGRDIKTPAPAVDSDLTEAGKAFFSIAPTYAGGRNFNPAGGVYNASKLTANQLGEMYGADNAKAVIETTVTVCPKSAVSPETIFQYAGAPERKLALALAPHLIANKEGQGEW